MQSVVKKCLYNRCHFPFLVDQIAPQALRLPPGERALLAASLWESSEDPYAFAADRSDEDAIILARDAELESGTLRPLSHVELMTRLRE